MVGIFHSIPGHFTNLASISSSQRGDDDDDDDDDDNNVDDIGGSGGFGGDKDGVWVPLFPPGKIIHLGKSKTDSGGIIEAVFRPIITSCIC